jgi:cephalosporin hydroxylase
MGLLRKLRNFAELLENRKRRTLFAKLASNVDDFIKEFRAIPDDLILDESYMEKFVIEKIGLNNEMLSEQPPELNPYYGKGLYIWQYPKQFAKYLIWLMKNAKSCDSYLEIGCRWGGTFIVICEVLRRTNPNFKCAIAVDIIAKTPFIERYSEIAKGEGIEIIYFQGFSTSNNFVDLVYIKKPDISFIDGDHSCFGAMQDHMLVRKYSKIIVHHDISSDVCTHTTFLWKSLKILETAKNNIEFTDQYQSVNGSFLGIGVLFSM